MAARTSRTNWKRKDVNNSRLADAIAGYIPGPILRLRFLQKVMPSPFDRDAPWSQKSRLLVSSLAALLLFTAPQPAPGVRTAYEIRRPSEAVSAGPAIVRVEEVPQIWQVERTDAFETYSNGLRIDNRFAIANHARSYLVFSATRPDDVRGERHSVPAGIVFHTTESLQAPFEPGHNSRLKWIGESLLAYVRTKRAYHFLIDRFGRVYRVVREGDSANHAGSSIWSDPDWLYLNLNQSFLAVSFETQTLPGQEEATVNPAQVRSAAMLTDMLRNRYGIPAGNCVTHAQVSVNNSNLRIGYHVDWASSFPFAQLGLPDNYARPLPSVFLAGFDYDSSFEHKAGERVYREAQLAEEILRDQAAAANLEVPVYRKALQKRYRTQLAAVTSKTNHMDDDE